MSNMRQRRIPNKNVHYIQIKKSIHMLTVYVADEKFDNDDIQAPLSV